MTPTHVFKSMSIAELFTLMANNEQFSTLSIRAYNEFRERYEKELWNICHAVCSKAWAFKIRDLDKRVYCTSMQEIYLKAKSFSVPETPVSKSVQEDMLIGWFSRIAESVKANIITENKEFEKQHLIVPDFNEHLEALKCYQVSKEELEEKLKKEELDDAGLLHKKEIFDKAFMKLNSREQFILLEYFNLQAGQKYLKADKIVYLCEQLGITHDNLLQIKFRGLRKFKRLCNNEQKKTVNKS